MFLAHRALLLNGNLQMKLSLNGLDAIALYFVCRCDSFHIKQGS